MSAPFDPQAALRALSDAGVAFVLIGGVAARVHGSPSMTRDLDVCHARDHENLERLSNALEGMHARLRGVDEDLPFLLDSRTLAAGANFTFITDEGDLDVLAMPSGVDGYEELARNATPIEIGGVLVHVCSLDDLIRMKRAAGRPKDRIEVEVLEALRAEINGDPDPAADHR
jgi:predicted nucleotidyltransferase